jgi:hypothetical protein
VGKETLSCSSGAVILKNIILKNTTKGATKCTGRMRDERESAIIEEMEKDHT